MSKWFVCAVENEEMQSNGRNKKVTKKYLVDAMSFTEAETRIIEEVTPFISGEFEVRAVAKENISEMFENPEYDKWFKAKVAFISLDEKSGMEKKTFATMYVQAPDFKKAVELLNEGMKGTMSDWAICAMAETAIEDIYKANL